MTIWESLSGIHEDGTIVAAGLFGGAARWATLRSHWKTGLIGVFVGGVSALYLSPLVEPWLGKIVQLATDDPSQTANFSGFIVGIGGITITGMVMDFIAARTKKEVDYANDDDDIKPPPKP